MHKQIFPSEILHFTLEQTFQRHSTRSQAIYIAIILTIIMAILALPFIYVDVSIQSRGILRSQQDISIISAPGLGKIMALMVSDNQYISKGDTLLVLDSPELHVRLDFLQNRITELSILNNDLESLISGLSSSAFEKIAPLKSKIYRQNYRRFKEQVSKASQMWIKAKQDWQRSKQLYNADAIAAMEYENAKYEYDNAMSDFRNLHQSFLSDWQDQLFNNKREVQKLRSELDQVRAEAENYIVLAPVNGTVQELGGLYAGSQVFANQQLCRISPDDGIEAECYLNPSDIGLIRKGDRVICQIDAFNYNQWGTLSGTIQDISNDVILLEGQPAFKVTSVVDRDFLSLKNGYKGHLRKGMTLNARFVVAERSLWQLLYDKIDDWLNPLVSHG